MQMQRAGVVQQHLRPSTMATAETATSTGGKLLLVIGDRVSSPAAASPLRLR